MKLTKKQRGQVVELLRCAADNSVKNIRLNGMFDAAVDLVARRKIDTAAWSALLAVRHEAIRVSLAPSSRFDEYYRCQLLEAAQRVEEGTWP